METIHYTNMQDEQMILNKKDINNFQHLIWDFYEKNRRSFAWRNTTNPYHIVVSEIMLQQTQTYRVEPKYDHFLEKFPTFNSLANATLSEVLAAWQGLGYNRRGKMLYETAKKVMNEFQGTLPNSTETLETFPGIGPATAASICAYAFNAPTVFIETNIRAVYIFHFFPGLTDIHDRDIRVLVEQTLDTENPREWYYALMDYGVYLKKNAKNPARKSAHHIKQSTFEGSDRQIRGRILKLLLHYKCLSYDSLLDALTSEQMRTDKILEQLCQEKLICSHDNYFMIADE